MTFAFVQAVSSEETGNEQFSTYSSDNSEGQVRGARRAGSSGGHPATTVMY